MDGKIKAPPSAGRMWLVGLEIFGVWPYLDLLALSPETPRFQCAKRHLCDRRVRSQP